MKQDLKEKYIQFCFKKLLPFVLLAIPLVIAHEFIHYSAIRLQGYSADFNYNALFPVVSYADISGLTKMQLFLTAISPYFLDLALLIGFYFYRKNKIARLLAWAPFLDIFWNFLMFLIGLALNKPNDFIVMFLTGNGIYAISLVILADLLWWKTIREN